MATYTNPGQFDPTQPVETRDGKPARIICTNALIPGYPIVALVSDSPGTEGMHSYTADGYYLNHSSNSSHNRNLVNIVNLNWTSKRGKP